MILGTFSVQASNSVCDSAAAVASSELGVPFNVLAAIARVETGQTRDGAFQPWPWTLNFAGDGRFYASRDAAAAAMEHARTEGQTNFDVGCFQINYRWHGDAFPDLDAMIDPLANARYAAQMLGEIFSETADWSVTAGQYHSRTPEFARIYRAKFDDMLASLDLQNPILTTKATRHNTFPLLIQQSDGHRAHGSLVPIQTNAPASRSLIGG